MMEFNDRPDVNYYCHYSVSKVQLNVSHKMGQIRFNSDQFIQVTGSLFVCALCGDVMKTLWLQPQHHNSHNLCFCISACFSKQAVVPSTDYIQDLLPV